MTSFVIADPLPAGEWQRHPVSLAEDAYRDGWTQRLDAAPGKFPRQLNLGELTAWTRGHAAAHRATVCVRTVREPLQPAAPLHTPLHTPPEQHEPPADGDQAALLVELLELEPPARRAAPFFDGTQPCAQVDPELFFPENGGHGNAAKRLCTTCEFRAACLDYALHERVNGLPIFGIWGGTSEPQRRALRRAAASDGELLDEAVA